MAKRSHKSSRDKAISPRRAGHTQRPAPGQAAVRQDLLWTEVLGDGASTEHLHASTKPFESADEIAFFDRGLSLQHAVVVDDEASFDDLDASKPHAAPPPGRRRSLRALVATVVAAAAAVLALGFGKTASHADLGLALTRATPVESVMTACDRALPHDKRTTTAAASPAKKRRR